MLLLPQDTEKIIQSTTNPPSLSFTLLFDPMGRIRTPTAKLIPVRKLANDADARAAEMLEGRDCTEMVSVEGVPDAEAVTEAGLRLQVVPAGVEQLNVTGSENPLLVLTDTGTMLSYSNAQAGGGERCGEVSDYDLAGGEVGGDSIRDRDREVVAANRK